MHSIPKTKINTLGVTEGVQLSQAEFQSKERPKLQRSDPNFGRDIVDNKAQLRDRAISLQEGKSVRVGGNLAYEDYHKAVMSIVENNRASYKDYEIRTGKPIKLICEKKKDGSVYLRKAKTPEEEARAFTSTDVKRVSSGSKPRPDGIELAWSTTQEDFEAFTQALKADPQNQASISANAIPPGQSIKTELASGRNDQIGSSEFLKNSLNQMRMASESGDAMLMTPEKLRKLSSEVREVRTFSDDEDSIIKLSEDLLKASREKPDEDGYIYYFSPGNSLIETALLAIDRMGGRQQSREFDDY